MAEKIKIAELDIDTSALIKSTKDLKKQIDILKADQKELTKAGQTSSTGFVQNAADLKVLSSAYNSNIKAIADSTKAKVDETNRTDLLNIAINDEVTSIKEAREQNKLLNRLRNETNVTTEEGQEQLNQLNAKLDSNNDFIKENADNYLKQKINIGNYSDSIKEAFSDLNLFNGGIGGFITRSQQAGGVTNLLTRSLKSVTVAIGGMIRASLAFLATPIGAVIAAVGVVLASVINYLKSTQAGIDAITSVTRPLSAIFQSLIGVLQDVGKYLYEAFTNPKNALTDIYKYVKDKVVKQFNALYDIALGIATLDFAQAKKGFKDLGDNIKDVVNDVSNAGKNTSKFFQDAINKGKEIDRLIKEREVLETSIASRQAVLNKALAQQRTILSDTAKSGQERVVAANEAERISKELIANQNEILDLQIEELKIKQSLNDTSREENKQLDELIAKRTDNQKQLDQQQKQNIAARKKLADEQKEAAQKLIELEINKSRQEIDLFVAQQGFKKKSDEDAYQFRKQLLDKELTDLELRYDKGKISKEEYETAKLNLTNDFAKQNADALLANAELELEAIRGKNNSILEIDSFLNDKLLQNKKDSLNSIAEAEREYQATRLETGVINEQDYNNEINKINEENRLKKQELDSEREAAAEEKRIADLELKREQDQLTFEEQLAIDLERMEISKNQELKNAENTGASLKLINEKYAAAEEKLKQQVELSKVSLIQSGLSQAKGLFKENTLAYKAIAIAEATMNTYKAASLALSTYAYPVGGIFAGLAIGQGLLQVDKIAGVKFEKGGIQEAGGFSRIGGKDHSQGGTKFYGEDGTVFEAQKNEGIGILNRGAYASFMDFNNRFGSGNSSSGFFEGGGIITQGVKEQTTDITGVAEAIANMPNPVVAVEEIQRVGNNYVSVQNMADL